jgi:toxin ParE1/3/4
MPYGCNVYKTAQARQDIYEVFFQIALDNVAASANLKERLEICLQTLGKNPEMGASRPAFGRGVRFFPFEQKYLIVYRPVRDGVEILRFLHGARDLEALL